MMTTVITLPQKGCRSLSPVLPALTLAKNLLCLLVAILLVASPAAAQQGGGEHQLDEADINFQYLSSCLDLPNERTPVQGFVAFMENVVCSEPKVCECVWFGFLGLLCAFRPCVSLPRCYSVVHYPILLVFPCLCISSFWAQRQSDTIVT